MMADWKRLARGCIAAVGLALLAACGGGTDSPPPPEPPVANTAPMIAIAPASVSVAAGQPASFSVTVSGTAPLSYQWQRNGNDIAGATDASYSIAAPSEADSGALLRVVVTNAAGTATSSAAVLSVGVAVVAAPSIIVQPQSASTLDGTGATFSVAAQGTDPFIFRWRRNGTDIADATGSSYTTPALAVPDSGAVYSVVVSNAAGSVTSANATLTVTPVPPSIASAPAPVAVSVGQIATFSVTAAGTAPLAYQWRRNGVVIAGATSASYATSAAALADNGALFSVVVSNAAASATSANAALSVSALAAAPGILTAPQNATVSEGQAATFSATASGTAPLVYQWRRNGSDISGANATSYTTPAATLADNGARYSLRVSNSVGAQTSADAALTVQAANSPLIGRAWSAGQMLETDDNPVNGRVASIDDAGRVTVLFSKSDGTRDVLYATRGTPNGPNVAPTWTTPEAIDLLNGTPVSRMGSSPDYGLVAPPGGDVVAYWFNNAPCSSTTYNTSGTCRYYYFARYRVANGTWESPTLLTDTPSNIFSLLANDRGDLVFFGNGWVRSGASSYKTSWALFMRAAGETAFRRQLVGTEPINAANLHMDGAGNLLMAAQYQQNATTDLVAYRGTVVAGLGTPLVLDTRGAAATLEKSAIGLNGHQIVTWRQNNGVQTTVFAAVSTTANGTFTLTDLGIGSIDGSSSLTISDSGQAYLLDFNSSRRLGWSSGAWSASQALPDLGFNSISEYAVNRNGDYVGIAGDSTFWNVPGLWVSYDANRNVFVRTPKNTTPSDGYILGLKKPAGYNQLVLSIGGIAAVTLRNSFDVLPTIAVPAGDGRNVTNLWGAFLK